MGLKEGRVGEVCSEILSDDGPRFAILTFLPTSALLFFLVRYAYSA